MIRRLGHAATTIGMMLLGSVALTNCGSASHPAALLDTGSNVSGVWNASFNVAPWGPVNSQLILKADGTYQKMDTANGSPTLISGTFQMVSSDKRLRLNIQHAEPTQACGPLGCNAITYPASENYTYDLSANTLTLTGIGCPPPQCTYVYKR